MQHHFTPTPAQKQHFAEALYPAIQAIARKAWRGPGIDGDRDDWEQDVVLAGLKGYYDCLANGNTSYTAATLAKYAIRHVRVERRVHSNPSRSLEGRKAYGAGIRPVPPHQALAEDIEARKGRRAGANGLKPHNPLAQFEGRAARPDDIVAFRLDVPVWLASISATLRRTAEAIVQRGPWVRLQDVARQLGISPGRLSQRRAELLASWHNITR